MCVRVCLSVWKHNSHNGHLNFILNLLNILSNLCYHQQVLIITNLSSVRE